MVSLSLARAQAQARGGGGSVWGAWKGQQQRAGSARSNHRARALDSVGCPRQGRGGAERAWWRYAGNVCSPPRVCKVGKDGCGMEGVTRCPKCHQLGTKSVSHTEANPGRPFLRCVPCKGFLGWILRAADGTILPCVCGGTERYDGVSHSEANPGRVYTACATCRKFLEWKRMPVSPSKSTAAASTASQSSVVSMSSGPHAAPPVADTCLKCGAEAQYLLERVSRTAANPNRPYLSCSKCGAWVKWVMGVDVSSPGASVTSATSNALAAPPAVSSQGSLQGLSTTHHHIPIPAGLTTTGILLWCENCSEAKDTTERESRSEKNMGRLYLACMDCNTFIRWSNAVTTGDGGATAPAPPPLPPTQEQQQAPPPPLPSQPTILAAIRDSLPVIMSMRVDELKASCRAKGLPVSGTKTELIQRLLLSEQNGSTDHTGAAAAAVAPVDKSVTQLGVPAPDPAPPRKRNKVAKAAKEESVTSTTTRDQVFAAQKPTPPPPPAAPAPPSHTFTIDDFLAMPVNPSR